jgi:pyridoxine/pyridoxamine 5'-phosphate oxidase
MTFAPLTRDGMLGYLRGRNVMAVSSIGANGAPQAAIVGYGVSDSLEIVFDTLSSTRKYANLQKDPRVALIVGWDDTTLQMQGSADFPEGDELERMRQVYFVAYPDGRDRLAWPGITHVRVRIEWARFSDFTSEPARIVELGAPPLG